MEDVIIQREKTVNSSNFALQSGSNFKVFAANPKRVGLFVSTNATVTVDWFLGNPTQGSHVMFITSQFLNNVYLGLDQMGRFLYEEVWYNSSNAGPATSVIEVILERTK